ncbi:MHC class II transactivator isoform X1 [Pleurodeles waltl]|uniref:MHC class II transactivator isoform X1 n=1 Tax=Pleurodeles waltl TaxID=8319 RepID=UPI0037095878
MLLTGSSKPAMEMPLFANTSNKGLVRNGVNPDCFLEEGTFPAGEIMDSDQFGNIDFLTEYRFEDIAEIAEFILDDKDGTIKTFLELDDPVVGSSIQKRNFSVTTGTQTDEPNCKRKKQGPSARKNVGKRQRLCRKKVIQQDRVPAPTAVHGIFTLTPCSSNVSASISSFVPHAQVPSPMTSSGGLEVPAAISGAEGAPLGSGWFQITQTIAALPQDFISIQPGSHVSNIIICPAPAPAWPPQIAVPLMSAFTPGNAALGSIPTSPDRSASCSPFVPTNADMPSMPQAASISHCTETDCEMCIEQLVTPNITSTETPKKPKYVEAFQSLLKERWKDTTPEPKGTQKDIYTDITLLQNCVQNKSCNNTAKGVEKLTIYDVTAKEKSLLERSNLFQVTREKPRETKTVVLLGQAGMGKSVLVKKICQDWSAGGYSEFVFVFCFEYCQFSLTGQQYSLKDLLFELSAKPEEKCDEVFKYILRNPHEVLLIFDGFDKVQDFDGLTHCPVDFSFKQSYTMKDLFAGIFLKKLLQGCTVLITAQLKEKFNQHLAKADKVVEIIGFSPKHIDEYMEKHFENVPYGTDCMKQIKECQYLFSYCYIPLMCRLICVVSEAVFKERDRKMPSTLTSLFANLIIYNLVAAEPHSNTNLAVDNECFAKLTSLALTLGEKHQNGLMHSYFPSIDKRDFALKNGFMKTFPVQSDPLSKERSVFSDGTLENFFVALKLVLSHTVKGKSLLRYISFKPRKKKLQDQFLCIVPRFLTGLLFFEEHLNLGFTSEKKTKNSVHEKRNAVLQYLKTLLENELSANTLLELCHCVYESQDKDLLGLTASKLEGNISFQRMHLTPPDVHVLQHVLRRSSNLMSLDLTNTGIQLQDLKELVNLNSVSMFRASLGDTVRLWELLHQSGEFEPIRLTIKKFVIEPFKAKSMKDVEDISALVQFQAQIINCIHEIPTIKTLKKIEFALGPVWGSEGFFKLVKILPAFSSLLHLDLNALSGNNIGDKGAEKLSEIFRELTKLETLDLSQNRITDLGVEKLAQALPSLTCLQKLSLYNNQIGDYGAEKIGDILPLLTSLTVLALQYNRITDTGAQKLTESLRKCPNIKRLTMWNSTIPHGVLERLQKQDPRIS